MKSFTIKKPQCILAGILMVFTLSAPLLSHAGDRDHNRYRGYDGFGKVDFKDHHRDRPRAHRHDNEHGKHGNRGFKRGHHSGHDRGHGKRRGHDRHNNPWYRYYKAKHDKDVPEDDPVENPGVMVDLTIRDRALNPGTTFNVTYNSLMTIQEVLTDLLGDSAEGYALQECYEMSDPIAGTYNDCDPDETPDPLTSDLTLEAAGIVDDPVVYLVNTAP